MLTHTYIQNNTQQIIISLSKARFFLFVFLARTCGAIVTLFLLTKKTKYQSCDKVEAKQFFILLLHRWEKGSFFFFYPFLFLVWYFNTWVVRKASNNSRVLSKWLCCNSWRITRKRTQIRTHVTVKV